MARGTWWLLCWGLAVGCTLQVVETDAAEVALTQDAASLFEAPTCDQSPAGDSSHVTFFRLEKDQRECASPYCGGYFLRAANVGSTICHDGRVREACYVATLDMPNGLTPRDGDVLEGAFAMEKAKAPTPSLGHFFVRRHFAGTLLGEGGDVGLYRVMAPDCDGARCWPTVQALNHTRTSRAWVGFVGGDCDVRSALAASYGERLTRDGESIVAARGLPMFGMTWLLVENVMLPRDSIRDPGGEGAFCGGIAAFPCAAGLECVLDGDYPDAGGRCELSGGNLL